MEIVLEILLELYLELMTWIIPDKCDKKQKRLATAIAITVVLGVIALAIWGVVLIADGNNMLGIIPLSIAILLSVIQIAAGIVAVVKRGK